MSESTPAAEPNKTDGVAGKDAPLTTPKETYRELLKKQLTEKVARINELVNAKK